MRAHFRLSDLIPAESNAEAVHHRRDVLVVVAHGQSRDCKCPECGKTSHRVHSRYPRMIADLPRAGSKDRIAPDRPTRRGPDHQAPDVRVRETRFA
ncbi:transposase family protein [Rhizobium leguminosarum]